MQEKVGLPSRRTTLASVGAAAIALIGFGSGSGSKAATPGARPRGRELSPDEALRLMKEQGIINKDVTWARMEEVSRRLGSGGGNPWIYKWCVIVKNKFVYRDDAL